MSILATIATVALVAGLFILDRDREVRTSRALWIPILWLLIVSSRPVSLWLHLNRQVALSDQYTEGSPIDAAVYGVLIVAGLVVLNRRWKQVRSYLLCNLPILVFFAYCALSVTWADAPAVSLKRWVKALGDLVVILVVLSDAQPLAALRKVFAQVGFILLPLSILFIKFFPSIGTTYDASDRVTMYCGVTTFKNLLGVTCMVFGLGAFWTFLGALFDRNLPRRKPLLLMHGAVVLMAVWLTVKADSMTALACFGLAGLVMAMSTQRMARRPAGLFALVCGTTAMAVFVLFFDSAGSMLHSIGRNATLTGRTQIWAAVLAQHINPILGTGFESFWMGSRMQSVWDMSQVGIEEAHNGYLELYLNLGWIGVALLMVLIVTGYRNAVRLFREDTHAGMLRISFFVCGLIYSCTEAGFRMLNPIWIMFLLGVMATPGLPVHEAVVSGFVPLGSERAGERLRILQ